MNFQTWFISEKIDGMMGLWNGKQMFTKKGELVKLPKSWTKDFPTDIALVGELKIPSLPRPKSNGFFLRNKPNAKDSLWDEAKYFIFDIPSSTHNFSKNINKLIEVAKLSDNIMYLSQSQVKDQNILQLMDEIVAGGGEGCVLRADRPYDHPR